MNNKLAQLGSIHRRVELIQPASMPLSAAFVFSFLMILLCHKQC